MRQLLLPLALFGTPLCAQGVHLVGPGGLNQIRDAIAIAAPGDVIHVLPGTYPHFTVDRAVTIRALVPGTVGVAFDPALEDPACLASTSCALGLGTTLFAPPTGARVHVVGIDFIPNIYPLAFFFAVRHRVRVTSGIVTFDDCRLRATDTNALLVESAQVHLQDCILTAMGTLVQGQGIEAVNAKVTAVDCTITGNSTGGLNDGGSAVRLYTGSSLQASHCTLTGGTQVGQGTSGRALFIGGSGSVWIRDSMLVTDGSTCAIIGSAPVTGIARTTITPGGSGCGVLTPAPLVGVTRPVPLQNGTSFTASLLTEPGTLVAVHASPRLGHVTVPGPFAQPIALDPAAFWLAGLYVSDSNGEVVATWDLPAGQYVDETVWLQAMALMPDSTFQLAPAVGGVVR